MSAICRAGVNLPQVSCIKIEVSSCAAGKADTGGEKITDAAFAKIKLPVEHNNDVIKTVYKQRNSLKQASASGHHMARSLAIDLPLARRTAKNDFNFMQHKYKRMPVFQTGSL